MKGNCGECEYRWFCEIDPGECDAWPDTAPMTNAQKIRSMSDEELCKLLMAIPNVPCDQNGYPEKCDLKCAECIMKWLQQPAEEGAK